MTQYLFNSSGAWIAFRKDNLIFDREGPWIGWLPWSDGQVVDPDGAYLATIVGGDRLYRQDVHEVHDFPGYPGYNQDVQEDSYPGFAPSDPLPPDMTDVAL
jgi:hypothetical protein